MNKGKIKDGPRGSLAQEHNNTANLIIVLLSILIFTAIVCITMKSWAGTVLVPLFKYQSIADILKAVTYKKPDP